jgi:hypothetical protein
MRNPQFGNLSWSTMTLGQLMSPKHKVTP